jgi:hypothetical protein
MQHNTAAGMPAHDGEESHKLQYTEEIKELVIDMLKAHVMLKVIKQGGLLDSLLSVPLVAAVHFVRHKQ